MAHTVSPPRYSRWDHLGIQQVAPLARAPQRPLPPVPKSRTTPVTRRASPSDLEMPDAGDEASSSSSTEDPSSSSTKESDQDSDGESNHGTEESDNDGDHNLVLSMTATHARTGVTRLSSA